MIQGYELAAKYCISYLVSRIDKVEIAQRYHSMKMIKSLYQVEKKLDSLESLQESLSEATN
jgi:hypothetical protein